MKHIQSLLTLTTLIDVILLELIIFVLLMELLMIVHNHGILVIYIILLKFFELILLLIDLINLLFIYKCKMKDINMQNSFNRLNLSLIFTFIRLIISLIVVRRLL